METTNRVPPDNASIYRLLARRSVTSQSLGFPGPDCSQMRQILELASRVPDHGNLEPWRFIVLQGIEREQASHDLAEIYALEKQSMEPSRLAKFKGIIARLFTYAPVVVLVVASPQQSTVATILEQHLSAGAVCMNLLTAVHVLGFHGNWLSGWVTSSAGARGYFRLHGEESFAGVIQIGTAAEIPHDRTRPDLNRIVTYWPG